MVAVKTIRMKATSVIPAVALVFLHFLYSHPLMCLQQEACCSAESNQEQDPPIIQGMCGECVSF